MKKIIDFQHPKDSSFVAWMHSGNIIKKIYNYKIYAILLKCQQKVLIIELKNYRDNAAIFHADGSLIREIKNPVPQALCFGDVFYVKDELTLISRKKDASMFAVVIDINGNVERVYETM